MSFWTPHSESTVWTKSQNASSCMSWFRPAYARCIASSVVASPASLIKRRARASSGGIAPHFGTSLASGNDAFSVKCSRIAGCQYIVQISSVTSYSPSFRSARILARSAGWTVALIPTFASWLATA